MKRGVAFYVLFIMLALCTSLAYSQNELTIAKQPVRHLVPGDGKVEPAEDSELSTRKPGDVNGDDNVDISDIVAIINLIAQNDKSNQHADVNADGSVDISDIVAVINIIANPYHPLSLSKLSIVLWTNEYESVWINSGNGKYEVTNENPNVVSVDGKESSWGGRLPRKTAFKPVGEQVAISGGNETHYFENIDYLKITALQPGSSVVRVKDLVSMQVESVNVVVKERVCEEFYPADYADIEGTTVGFKFTVLHPWTGDISFRISLSTDEYMAEDVITADITVNGKEGEKTYYNQDGKIITFSNLRPNTRYYWKITYYDKNESSDIECYSSAFDTEPAPTDISELCPDANHPHVIDMGEAGKWSCCNVGATSPEQAGNQYAWGETIVKPVYEWSNYSLADGSRETCYDIGNDIAGTRYDAALVNWGEAWRLPDYNQSSALLKLEAEWAKVNGVVGTKFKSPNGNCVFLPYVDRYWTSSASSYPFCFGSYPIISYMTNMFEPHLFHGERDRCDGLYVRPFYYEDPAVAAGLCPDSNHPHVIDMGQAGKWACCNVGAANPSDYGDYYAWGETETKDEFSWGNYVHCDGDAESCHDIGRDISGTEYDAAYVNWGVSWTMINYDIAKSLIDNCTAEATSIKNTNGIDRTNGVLFTASNGNRLFLPQSYYWTSSLDRYGSLQYAQTFSLYENLDYLRLSRTRYTRAQVRPVLNTDPAVDAGICPDSNHPHVIDMGVAGKWACCNVGAKAPWEYGGYYAWGETEEKDWYDWSSYTHCDGSSSSCHSIGSDIAGTEYDVAHVKWGDKWKMPNKEQARKLVVQCSIEKVTVNGVDGEKFTASNGCSIFIPASGYRVYRKYKETGENGYYWSSSLDEDEDAIHLMIWNWGGAQWLNEERRYGYSVRPVQPDYTLDFCNITSPQNGTSLDGTNVLFDFTVNPIWNGSLSIRILLSEDEGMVQNTNNIDFMLKGKVGTPTSFSSEISGLKPNTTYYWRMTYYDWDSDSYVNCSPQYSFTTGN